MGYNSDSTNFQGDPRPAMLNPLDMCEVTRGHGADLTEKDEGRESQFLSFIFFLVEKPDVPAVQPATQSRRERHHQQNTNDQNRDIPNLAH